MKRRWALCLVGMALCAGVLAACRAVPRETDHVVGLESILAEKSSAPTLVSGSQTEREAIARLKEFLGNWSLETVRNRTLEVYASDAWLNDTLKTLRGATNIQNYFLRTVENSESLRVSFQDVTRADDGLYYFRWTMENRLKKVAKGETLRTPGITLVRFDAQGRVQIHQDYWDSAGGLFDHIPGVGYAIRSIKARL